MPGAADTLTTVRDGIAAMLRDSVGIKVYDHTPLTFDELPAIEMALPEIGRTDPDEAESELFRTDWRVTYPIIVNVALDPTPAHAQNRALELAAIVIGAVDTDPTFGGLTGLVDAKATTSKGGFVLTDAKGADLVVPRCTYECAISFLLLVS